MKQLALKSLMVLFAFASMLAFVSCDSSDDKSTDEKTSLEKAVVGSWYSIDDNYIYLLDIKSGGKGSMTTYKFESNQWTESTTSLQYTISNSIVTVKLQDEDAWSGALAVTGNNMSITRDTSSMMFTRYDGNLDNLKREVEDNWLDLEPGNQTTETNFYYSEENVKTAINALYLYLKTYEYNQLNLENIRIYGYDLHNNAKQISSSSTEIEDTWNSAYNLISNANMIINALQSDDLAKYITYRNEALAIRCLVYYNIANLWGSVPYTETSGEQLLTNPTVYTCEQVMSSVENTLEQLGTSRKEEGQINYDYINYETVTAMQGEIALWRNDKTIASQYFEFGTPDFGIILTEQSDPDLYKIFGDRIPNYTADIIALLKQETQGNTSDLVGQWQSLGTHVWGYWAMLKRTNNAMSVSGCQDYELLMPIPSSVIAAMPNIAQNPGY